MKSTYTMQRRAVPGRARMAVTMLFAVLASVPVLTGCALQKLSKEATCN
jgi:hypothetical protein